MCTSRAARDTFVGHMKLLDWPDKRICLQDAEIGSEAGAKMVSAKCKVKPCRCNNNFHVCKNAACKPKLNKHEEESKKAPT